MEPVAIFWIVFGGLIIVGLIVGYTCIILDDNDYDSENASPAATLIDHGVSLDHESLNSLQDKLQHNEGHTSKIRTILDDVQHLLSSHHRKHHGKSESPELKTPIFSKLSKQEQEDVAKEFNNEIKKAQDELKHSPEHQTRRSRLFFGKGKDNRSSEETVFHKIKTRLNPS